MYLRILAGTSVNWGARWALGAFLEFALIHGTPGQALTVGAYEPV